MVLMALIDLLFFGFYAHFGVCGFLNLAGFADHLPFSSLFGVFVRCSRLLLVLRLLLLVERFTPLPFL